MGNEHLARTEATRDMDSDLESRFTNPRPECERPEFWTSNDIEATENEVIDGVYGLVRMLQPEYVVETGTHRGFMAKRIGEALRDNGHGRLDTVEIENELYEEAFQRVQCGGKEDAPLPVTCRLGDALKFDPVETIDFAWLDSGGPKQRALEFMRYFPHMHDQTIVGFHDSGTHHKYIRLAVLELMVKGYLVPIFLPTPRGVALCQVVKYA